MPVAKKNKTVPVTLTKYHLTKLSVMCQRTGLTKTEVIQRLIENHDPFAEQGERESTEKSA